MKVAVIEPVGGHGGMDYYDFGLCGGLSEANVDVTLYTCDETAVKTAVPYTLRFPYRRIYGDAPAWMRGARYVYVRDQRDGRAGCKRAVACSSGRQRQHHPRRV